MNALFNIVYNYIWHLCSIMLIIMMFYNIHISIMVFIFFFLCYDISIPVSIIHKTQLSETWPAKGIELLKRKLLMRLFCLLKKAWHLFSERSTYNCLASS